MPSFLEDAGYLVTDNDQWFPTAYTGSISRSGGGDMGAEFVSATGKRSMMLRGRHPRKWSVSGEVPWDWAVNLDRLGKIGGQRFYWLSPLGKHINVLPSDAMYNAQKGAVRLIDGEAVQTYTPSSANSMRTGWAPVKEGVPVTVRGYLRGGRLMVIFTDSTDAQVGFPSWSAPDGGFIERTTVAPTGATKFTVLTPSATEVGSLTAVYEPDSEAFPVSGSECAYVTLENVQVEHAVFQPGSPLVSISYDLVEVN